MSGALPTPSEPADTPDGSDSVARRLSPEEGSTKGAEVKRRAHRKSRFGCKNCKLRRIKCDEQKPECTNCRNRQVRCDYLPSVAASPSAQAAVTTAAPSPTESLAAPGLFRALNVDDVELMYHWTTSTSATLSSQNSGAIFWRTQVTEIALSHHHILHLILAITATHLSRFRLQRRDEYLALADHHYGTALPTITAELFHLNQDNCDAVLLSVQLICFLTWARGPQPGEYLAFGENGRSDWLVMFRGIRTTIETVGYDNFTRSMAPNIRAKGKSLPRITGLLAYEEPLAELRDYVQHASEPSHLSHNLYAHQVLLECYSNRYGGVDSEYHVVFAWLFRMQEEFLEALQKHDPVPLVVYAHFALLMNDMEGFWYMKGWTVHVLEGIWGILRDEDRVHIRWPVSVVGWIPP